MKYQISQKYEGRMTYDADGLAILLPFFIVCGGFWSSCIECLLFSLGYQFYMLFKCI
jgi:hypothetical protein